MSGRFAGLPHRIVVTILGAIAVVAIGGGFLLSSTEPGISAINVNADRVAIRGYDTVAYFTDGTATKGSEQYEHEWQGARWHFANATHRDLFAANPERYAPRYGGYCSMGLAIGEYSDADPEQWTIVDGKLYLNKAPFVAEMWRKAPDAYIAGADINWEKYRDQLRVNESLRSPTN